MSSGTRSTGGWWSNQAVGEKEVCQVRPFLPLTTLCSVLITEELSGEIAAKQCAINYRSSIYMGLSSYLFQNATLADAVILVESSGCKDITTHCHHRK